MEKGKGNDILTWITDNSLLAIFAIVEGRTAYVNKYCANLLELSESELLHCDAGSIINRIVEPMQRDYFTEMYRSRLEGNILDIVYLINYKYKNGLEPFPFEAGEADCEPPINILDIIYLINYKYKNGPPPCSD